MPTHRQAIYLATTLALTSPAVAQTTMICQQLPDGAIYCPRPTPPQMVVLQQPAPVVIAQPQPYVRHVKAPPVYTPDPAIQAPLPDLDLPPDAGPHDYLRAAREAIYDRQADRAQAALEAAETRVLSRSVPVGATDRPIVSHMTHLIEAALLELKAGHWGECDDLVLRALRKG